LSEEVFLLPDVGEGLVEAEIVTWKVKEGDLVTLNQPLVDIETAKATVELPSPYAGTVRALHGEVGDVMKVNEPLITFDVADGGPSSDDATTASPTTLSVTPLGDTPADAGREAVLVGYGVANEDALVTRSRRRNGATTSSDAITATARSTTSTPLAPRTTPPVRLYAKQRGVDLATLTGSGRGGLITRDDVDRAIAPLPSKRTTNVARASGASTPSLFVGREIESWSTGPKEERIAVRGVLRSMSDAMVQSAFSAPHAAVWVRCDVTKTVELLAGLRKHPKFSDVRLSPLVLVAMAFCDAARHFAGINSSFDASSGEVIVRRSVNLGVAADTPRGLIVPNIKAADELDLVGMATSLSVLVEKARNGTTTPNEMLGTTLTITNVGPFGVDAAVPILPPGTGAILAVGQIVKAPWVVEDQVVVRHVVELSLAFDHRQIDGALASRVVRHVADYLGEPAPAMLAG
jgi:pyruvate dehydrogenase E2 component (dihydrolipoamide acetyltransferase)